MDFGKIVLPSTSFDPFADTEGDDPFTVTNLETKDDPAVELEKPKIRISFQPRNGKKGMTNIENLDEYVGDLNKFKKTHSLGKKWGTKVTIKTKKETDKQIMVLQGNWTNDVKAFLMDTCKINKGSISL